MREGQQLNETSEDDSPYKNQVSGTEEPDLGEDMGEGDEVYGGEEVGDTS